MGGFFFKKKILMNNSPKISFKIPYGDEKKHKFGVNKLLISGNLLYSAGREGSIKSWSAIMNNLGKDPSDEEMNHDQHHLKLDDMKPIQSIQAHTNWVTDLAIMQDEIRIIFFFIFNSH